MNARHEHYHHIAGGAQAGAEIVVRTTLWIILGVVAVALTLWWALT